MDFFSSSDYFFLFLILFEAYEFKVMAYWLAQLAGRVFKFREFHRKFVYKQNYL